MRTPTRSPRLTSPALVALPLRSEIAFSLLHHHRPRPRPLHLHRLGPSLPPTMLPKLPNLCPRSPPTPFNPHRDALAAYCKSPYRQCSAHLYRQPLDLSAEHCRYGTTDLSLAMAAQIRVLRSAMMVFAGEGIRRDVILGCDAGNNQHCTTPYELPRKVVARLRTRLSRHLDQRSSVLCCRSSKWNS